MNKVTILDKTFDIMLTEQQILDRVEVVAQRINKDMAGKCPIFMVVLNGAYMFAADLLKRITIPCEVSFVKCMSYQGTKSTGTIKQLIGYSEDLSGRAVIIVEDIIETGRTMAKVSTDLRALNPAELHICSLFVKPDTLKVPLDITYRAMEIGNEFIVGYGLDYNGQGRNLKDLYVLSDEQQTATT